MGACFGQGLNPKISLLPSLRSLTLQLLGHSKQRGLTLSSRKLFSISTNSLRINNQSHCSARLIGRVLILTVGPKPHISSICNNHLRNLSSHSFAKDLNLQSSSIPFSAATALAAALALVSWALFFLRTDTDEEDRSRVPFSISDMSPLLEPGHVGNLSLEQEEKLRRLWLAIFQVYGVFDTNETSFLNVQTSMDKQMSNDLDAQKKKRFGVFRRKGSEKASIVIDPSDEDKYGLNKAFQEILARESPEAMRDTIWSMVKHDHPDTLLLRFLRARKWDVEKALVMMVSTMNWRHNQMKVDNDIMKNGEGGAAADEQGANGDTQKILGHDFMTQIRMGKSFLHGVDKHGRPICIVRVRLHKQGDQREESLERYIVYIIETARMVLAPPVDTATILFDMTGFSMANLDYTPIKFMIKCFEANFPESLGAVLVHNSPWIFQGIWKIIRGWLDPVVASKVHFTNNKTELEVFIEPGRILKELGGDEDWDYRYIEPIAGENDLMKDTETRDGLLQVREDLIKDFEATTLQWIHAPDGNDAPKIKAQRADLADKLREGYWRLDPYIRARSLYDRQGVIQGGAEARWYPAQQDKLVEANGPAALEASLDDLD